MVKVNYIKDLYAWMAVPLAGFLVGWKLDRMEDERLSRFRDKSALYGKAIPPATPSW